ncbi:uncharacterized protein LOC121379283 [Gigantopelta aegis]|uniref:uncharacterized protein LOC121379283 n=1 Tax=Gigantopelta aegis TaxID=1735272 RepID=UPI001B889A76|nr:uncharacterized protein LOC121379283 [Gigantopelta aegis]XP_041363763.1 uncharacterized protein LOC121379283 [Gigantopelta aegis]
MAVCNPKDTVEVDKDHLCCCICISLLTVPKMLGCGHTFCRQCLQNYIEHQKDAVQRCGFDCPLCNQFTTIPNPVAGWADQFATDFRIQAMIEGAPDSVGKPVHAEGAVSLQMSDVPARDRKFILVNTIPSRRNEDTKVPRIIDLVVLVQEGRDVIVVCDSDNTCVKAFWFDPLKDREMSCKLIIDSQDNIVLGRMAKINDTQIALSVFQSTKIYIINVNNGLSIHTTMDTGSRLQGIGVIKSQPHSAPETRLVVGFEGGLSVLDIDGTIVKPMDIDIFGSKYTGKPWYLAITPACNILVSDSHNCLLCVTQKREVLWKYPTKDPAGVDCDAHGNIYLAICSENKVVLLSPGGKVLKEVLSHSDRIQTPRGICYSSEKSKLYIAELNGLIKIFEHK